MKEIFATGTISRETRAKINIGGEAGTGHHPV